MALLHRIAAALLGACIPAITIGAGCSDKLGNFNGLGNEMTNHGNPAAGAGAGGAHGTGGASTGTGTGTGGNLTGLGLCPCVLGLEVPGLSQACVTCADMAVAGGPCSTAATNCMSGTGFGPCHADLTCVKGCNGDEPCIAQCLLSPTLSQQYVDLLNCTCKTCSGVCPTLEPVSACVPSDGGGDAAEGG